MSLQRSPHFDTGSEPSLRSQVESNAVEAADAFFWARFVAESVVLRELYLRLQRHDILREGLTRPVL